MGLTEAQLAFRRNGMGGSDVAGLIAGRQLDVWLDKKGRSKFNGNTHTEWGERHEQTILQKFSDVHGVALLYSREAWPQSVDGTLRHPQHALALATPDGVVVTERPVHLVQAKSTEVWSALAAGYGESGTSNVPNDKLAQVTWEMFVSGVHSATLAVLIGASDYREYPIPYDAELAGLLMESVERFWRDHIEADVQPPIDGSDSASEYLRTRFPRNNGKLLPATARVLELAREYDVARAEEKAAKERKETLGNRLRELIGDADGFEGPGVKVTSRLQSGAPKYKEIAEFLGASNELITKHTPSGRVLHVAVKE